MEQIIHEVKYLWVSSSVFTAFRPTYGIEIHASEITYQTKTLSAYFAFALNLYSFEQLFLVSEM